jgi:hypothetical protein
MAIFSLMATGTIGLTFMVRANSEQAVYNNTALALAQAYLEQLRSVDFSTLRSAALDASGTVPLTLIASNGTVLLDEAGGVFGNHDWARETIMLDEDENGTPKQPMTFRFRPRIYDLQSLTAGKAEGVEIVLLFESTYNFGSPRTLSGSLRTVRSNVSTY